MTKPEDEPWWAWENGTEVTYYGGESGIQSRSGPYIGDTGVIVSKDLSHDGIYMSPAYSVAFDRETGTTVVAQAMLIPKAEYDLLRSLKGV